MPSQPSIPASRHSEPERALKTRGSEMCYVSVWRPGPLPMCVCVSVCFMGRLWRTAASRVLSYPLLSLPGGGSYDAFPNGTTPSTVGPTKAYCELSWKYPESYSINHCSQRVFSQTKHCSSSCDRAFVLLFLLEIDFRHILAGCVSTSLYLVN